MGEETQPDHEHCSDFFLDTPTPEDVTVFRLLALDGIITPDVLQVVIDLRLKAFGVIIERVDA